MHTFATVSMEEVKGSCQTFVKLCIDGVCFLDEFEDEIKNVSQFYSEFKTILSYMNYMADGGTLPEAKFKLVNGGCTGTKQYEFRSKHLRVYACSEPGRKVVVMGGFKKNQKKDISLFHSRVREFVAYQKK